MMCSTLSLFVCDKCTKHTPQFQTNWEIFVRFWVNFFGANLRADASLEVERFPALWPCNVLIINVCCNKMLQQTSAVTACKPVDYRKFVAGDGFVATRLLQHCNALIIGQMRNCVATNADFYRKLLHKKTPSNPVFSQKC